MVFDVFHMHTSKTYNSSTHAKAKINIIDRFNHSKLFIDHNNGKLEKMQKLDAT